MWSKETVNFKKTPCVMYGRRYIASDKSKQYPRARDIRDGVGVKSANVGKRRKSYIQAGWITAVGANKV